jgi:hypothetical protein
MNPFKEAKKLHYDTYLSINEYPEKSTDYYLWDKAKDICIIYVDAIIKEKGFYEKEYKIIKKELVKL